MTAYLIGTIDVEDTDTYNLYRSLNPALVQAAGGKYIIKGKPVTTLEGEDFRSRMVMIEFANEATLQKFYNSPEYEKLRPLRQSSAKSTIAYVNADDGESSYTSYQIERFDDDVKVTPVVSALPELGPDDIRIQPTLIAVNPVDWKVCSGMLAALPFTMPYTPGCEGVGIVEAVGEKVTQFSPGQRVMAHSSVLHGGWYATKVDVPADQCARVPDDVSDENAAALSIALLTASQSIGLHDKAIKRALVIGASGAVGSIATALLMQMTDNVDAICSSSNAEHVSALGAKVMAPEAAAESEYDFVLDAAGGSVIEAGYRGLSEGGTLVSLVQPIDEARAQAKSAKAIRYSVQANGEQLSKLLSGHDKLPDPRIATLLPLEEVNSALHISRFGRMRGKILLKP